jgi:hypothetical protein
MARCLVAMYLQSPSGTWRRLFVLPPSLEACVFPKFVPVYLRCRILDSYVAVYCVLFYMTLLSATAISFVIISVFGCNAPLVRAVKLLSMRAPAQVSSDLVVCVEGETNSFSTVLGGRQWTRLSGSCSIVWHRSCCRPAVS